MTTTVSIVLDQHVATQLHERAIRRGETIGRLVLEAIAELDRYAGHATENAEDGHEEATLPD